MDVTGIATFAGQPLTATLAGVAALLIFILRFKMNAFAALILVSVFSAIAAGFSPEQAFETITKGMGGTLGFIAVVIGLGALFGAILEATGGIRILAARLMEGRSVGAGRVTMSAVGLLAAIPVFFDVALIILAPLVLAMARKTRRSAMTFGLPLLAGLAVAHSFIPPTPGPIAVAELMGADLAWMIVFGLGVGVFAAAMAGPALTALLDHAGALPDTNAPASGDDQGVDVETRGAAAVKTAVLIALPLLLILIGLTAKTLLGAGFVRASLELIGHPFMALLAACGLSIWAFPARTDAEKQTMKDAISRSLEPTGAVILVTGAGGAFKQVLVDTGAGGQLANAVLAFGMNPLFAGYVVALLVRVAQGSATVAMITAAGLTAPLAQAAGLEGPHLALVAIAIASGATALSHVNDSGFWLVSRIFRLSARDTLRTWTVTSTVISLSGLAGAALLYAIV